LTELKAGLEDEEGKVGLAAGGGAFLNAAMSTLPTGV
jgi:hypothetical protein